MRVVIVGYHNGAQLERLFRSLTVHLKVPAEILLWDNGGTREIAAKWQSKNPSAPFNMRIEGDGKNLGFAKAVNRAIALPATPHELFILNPDAELASDFTAEHLQALANLQGIAGLRVFDDSTRSRRQASARSFPSWTAAVAGREGLLTRWFPGNRWSRKYLHATTDSPGVQRVDWVSGCAMVVTKNIWERLGGFDESYFLYVEDVDLGRRAAQKRIPIFYVPFVDVIHHIRGSAARAPWKSDFYHHWGMWIYHVKWSGPLGFVLGPLVFAAIWVRFLFRRLAR